MKALILFDLTFGDSGKGTLIDYLTRRHNAHTVIRFNGGAQAAHNVILPDGRHHTFSQFGSGTFVEGVRTLLSRFVLLDPLALRQEERHLQTLGITDAFARLSVDGAAPVVTPFHKSVNRLREISRGRARHGSCGMGIGETMADLADNPDPILRAGDLPDPHLTRQKLGHWQRTKRAHGRKAILPADPQVDQELALLSDPTLIDEAADLFAQIAAQFALVQSATPTLQLPGTVLFEGAQGVLLDEWFGFHPYTTWSTTTPANALTLLHEAAYPGHITRIAALRAYLTRHGAGPIPTEDPALSSLPERHNANNPWQHHFRRAHLDLPLLHYAKAVVSNGGGVDQLALTCLDHLPLHNHWKIARAYANPDPTLMDGPHLRPVPTPDLDHQSRLANFLQQAQPAYEPLTPNDLPTLLQSELNLPITLLSHGPTHRDKEECSKRNVAQRPSAV